jgi:hypothetical protein
MFADKYHDALVAEYWSAWQRKLRREQLGPMD